MSGEVYTGRLQNRSQKAFFAKLVRIYQIPDNVYLVLEAQLSVALVDLATSYKDCTKRTQDP